LKRAIGKSPITGLLPEQTLVLASLLVSNHFVQAPNYSVLFDEAKSLAPDKVKLPLVHHANRYCCDDFCAGDYPPSLAINILANCKNRETSSYPTCIEQEAASGAHASGQKRMRHYWSLLLCIRDRREAFSRLIDAQM
jgi:hypothetical protein